MTVQHNALSAATAKSRPHSSADIGWTTFVLALVAMLASADRNILAILLVPIQREIGVSDAAMGALSGAAFSIVYGLAAIPLGFLADRRSRRHIIATAVIAWSVMTAACGTATSFLTLLLARMGVALGEAAHNPAIMSMVADLHPRDRRSIAVGCISAGSALGIGFGASLAGSLSDEHGWRTAFIVMAAPGALVALMMLLTVREPLRGHFDGVSKAHDDLGFAGSLRTLLGNRSFRRLMAAALFLGLEAHAFLTWAPTFFTRVHGLTTAEMSAIFGPVVGVSAMLSMFIGGFLSDRLSQKGERWRSWYCAMILAAGVPFALLMVLAPTATLSFGALFVMALITGAATSVSIAAGLGVVQPELRGFMTAMLGLVSAVVAGGLGPVALGALTDVLKGEFGDEAIRYTMLSVPLFFAIAAGLFYWTGLSSDTDAKLVTSGRIPMPSPYD